MLTYGGGGPLTVGSDITVGPTSYQFIVNAVYIDGVPATRGGTITTVRAGFAGSGTQVAFLTYNPSTSTVRAISANIWTQIGYQTYSVNLSVAAGDLIGLWADGGGNNLYRDASAAPSYAIRYADAAIKPTASQVLSTLTYTEQRYAIYGTG